MYRINYVPKKTEETLEFWMGDHFYRNSGYYVYSSSPDWMRYIPLILLGVAVIGGGVGIVVLVKRRKGK